MNDIATKEKIVLLVNDILKREDDFEKFKRYYEYLEEKFIPKNKEKEGYFVKLEDASSLKSFIFKETDSSPLQDISLKEETLEEKFFINKGKVEKILDILKGMELVEISFILEDVSKNINSKAVKFFLLED